MEEKRITQVKPTGTGNFGKYWNTGNTNPEKYPATITTFLVFAPNAHPLWSYYAIGLVDLKDREGIPTAVKFKDENATHEVFVFALNPEEPVYANPELLSTLRPMNFAGQFIAASDEEATEKVTQAAIDICNGLLSPDTDYIQQWVERFGDSNIKGY